MGGSERNLKKKRFLWQNRFCESSLRVLNIFACNFSEDVALLAQDILHTEIWACNGNEIIC